MTLGINRHGIDLISGLRLTLATRNAIRVEQANVFIPYTIKPIVFGSIGAHLAGVRAIYPLVTGLGSAFIGEAPDRRARFVRRVATSLYRLAFSFADNVFVQNPDDAADLRRLGALPMHKDHTILAGSGIDLDEYRQVALPAGPPRFLMISRLIADKGVREYADAARIVKQLYPDTEFHLVGPPDSNPTAISDQEVRSWTWLEYTPWLDDVRPAISRASVFVLPSYREGTPRSVLEAMAMGRPILTTDSPGCREPIVDGENGFLVPVRSSQKLADAMARFLDAPELIAAMGASSRRIAVSRYDARKVYDPLLQRIGLLAN